MYQTKILALVAVLFQIQGCTLIRRNLASQNKELVTAEVIGEGEIVFEVFAAETTPKGEQTLSRSSCSRTDSQAKIALINRENCVDKKVTVSRSLFDAEFDKSFESFVYSNEPLDFLETSSLLVDEQKELQNLVISNTGELKSAASPLQSERLKKAIAKYQTKIDELDKAIVFYSSRATNLPQYVTSLRKTWTDLNFWLQSPIPFLVDGGLWEPDFNNELPKATQTLAKIVSTAFANALLKSVEKGDSLAASLEQLDKLSWQSFVKNGRFSLKFKPLELEFIPESAKWQSFIVFNGGQQIKLLQGHFNDDTLYNFILTNSKGRPVCHFRLDELDQASDDAKKKLLDEVGKNRIQKFISKLNPKTEILSLSRQVDSLFAFNDLHLNFTDSLNFLNLERSTVSALKNDVRTLHMICGFIKSVKFHEKMVSKGLVTQNEFIVDSIELEDTLTPTISKETEGLENTDPQKFTVGHFKKIFDSQRLTIELKSF